MGNLWEVVEVHSPTTNLASLANGSEGLVRVVAQIPVVREEHRLPPLRMGVGE